MNEQEMDICLAMDEVLNMLDALLAVENAKGADKNNEQARFYAVARTHHQTTMAYFNYWLAMHDMFRRLQAGTLE